MRKAKYAQNFFHSNDLIEKLIGLSDLGSKDMVVEIGTGRGIITIQLCKLCRKVVSIEKDKRFYESATTKLGIYKNLRLVNKDIKNFALPDTSFKTFSNIPFNFTSDIVRKFILQKSKLQTAYFVMQKEAAIRFSQTEGGRTSLISLLIFPKWEVETVYKFEKNDFFPPPSKDIVFVEFKRRSKSLVRNPYEKLFRDFVYYSFSQWKPNLKSVLQNIFTYRQLKRLSRKYQFKLGTNPSNLKAIQWLNLFNFIIKNQKQVKAEKFKGYFKRYMKKRKNVKKQYKSRTF